MTIQILNENFELLPEKAFFWKKESVLGFSDVHLGKAESYQAWGVPMPSGAHKEDLATITQLIKTHQPKKVLILGDWIHQKSSWTEEIAADLHAFFLRHKDIEWTLILGNHERGSMEQLKSFPIKIMIDKFQLGPFRFIHGHDHGDPQNESKTFSIEGHIHPAVRLKEGSTSLRLPAFILTKNRLILPAFGSQTGGYEMKLSAKDRAFPTTGTTIFELSPRQRHPSNKATPLTKPPL